MDKLTIITWKWDDGIHPKKRITFTSDHVNRLYSMLKRHLHIPFELVCITDSSKGIDSEIRVIPLWLDYAWMGGCFRRLKVFSYDAERFLKCKRFISIDLDCIIVDDITPLFTRTENFLIWGESWRNQVYCGAFWMMDVNSRPAVWETFRPIDYPRNEKGNYRGGTDQKHINRILYPGEKIVGKEEGIYSFATDICIYKNPKIFNHRERKVCGGDGRIPKEAKIIFFNGKFDPSHHDLQMEYPWILENWV